MKNRFNLGIYFLCTAIFLSTLSCNTENKEKATDDTAPKAVLPPSNIVSLEQAKSIYDNYTEHRVNLIERYETEQRAPKEKFEPARFVDFDYEVLKEYIAYVDQEAEKAGVKKVTKLRMYFANYPNEDKFPDGKKVVHLRKNSIFLLPTMAADNGNYGFYIGDDGKPKLIADWTSEYNNGLENPNQKSQKSEANLVSNFFKSTNLLYKGTSLTLNYGGSGPPPKTDF